MSVIGNSVRSREAREIVNTHAIKYGSGEEEDMDTKLADLLADLRHLCDTEKLDFGEIDRRAYSHYAAEVVAER